VNTSAKLGWFGKTGGGGGGLSKKVHDRYYIYKLPKTTDTSIFSTILLIQTDYIIKLGARGSVVVEALCYKPGGRGFENR
jgi:hypothetical protein